MKSYFALFLIAITTSAVVTPVVRRLCERYRLVDEPLDDRRVHVKPIPRLGGVAIFLSVLVALSALLFVNNGLTAHLYLERPKIFAFLICATLVLALGVFDDIRGANASVKFIGLGLVGVLFYVLGGRILALSIPFVGGVNLPPIVGFVLTLVWVVGVANAFNLIDGVDGLAAGSALFTSLVILVVSLLQGNSYATVMALVFTGALAAFLRYNFNPASIFLGDSGALLVGFSLAALSIQGSQKSSTAVAVAIPIFAFGLPVVDTAVAIARRFISGNPIFRGDREHIHHMLLERGWSQRRVALVLYGVSAMFGLLGMLFVGGNPITPIVLFVVGIAVVIAVGQLNYPEVEEIRASVKRNIGDRRVRAANNIRVRRACRSMARAKKLDELFDGVLEMLQFGEFVYATVQLSHEEQPQVNVTAFESAIGGASMQHAELRDGRIQWTWKRDDESSDEIVGSNRFWSLRLPLATEIVSLGYINLYRPLNGHPMHLDINYLCAMFQPQLAEAAARIFATYEREHAKQVRAAAAGL